jgi:hypothetical protein
MTINMKHVAVGLCIFLLIGIIMVSVKPTTDINKEKSYKNIINKTIGSVLIVVSCIPLILLFYLKMTEQRYCDYNHNHNHNTFDLSGL